MAIALTLTLPVVAQELPQGAARANVMDYGAVGDGVHDDTEAIEDAIASTYSAWEQIYLPPGTYRVTRPITLGRFLTLRGAGPSRTVIRLDDGAPGYDNPSSPSWVLRTGDGGVSDHDNTTHSAHIMNLSVDVGAQNAGAVGIDLLVHNGGGIENVLIRAPARSGLRGLSLKRDSPGPGLVNRVTVEGFEYGIDIGWGVYGMTFEDITLRDQRKAGIRNDRHPLSIRRLFSDSEAPAIESTTTDYGMLVLLDSRLQGGARSDIAIVSDGACYLRNVESSGYRVALKDNGTEVAGDILERVSPRLERYQDSPDRSLNLPVANMFVPSLGSASTWTNVRDYEHLVSGDDWTPAIQAAIDSGATTLYFPSTTHAPYHASSDVIVRGALRNIVGMYANLGDGRLVFDTAEPDATIYVEQVRTDAGYLQRSPATVVLRRSMGGSVETEPGAGDLFVDDWCCGNFDVHGSDVWVRQLNEESLGTKLTVTAGKLWVLGLKTEQFGTVGYFAKGAAVEILGGLIYPAQGAPATPMYVNSDSSFAAFHREIGNGYPSLAQEIHEGDSEVINPGFTQGTLYVSNLTGVGSEPTGKSGLDGSGNVQTGSAAGNSGGSGLGGGSARDQITGAKTPDSASAEGAGCSCGTAGTGSQSAASLWYLVAFAALWRRRRSMNEKMH